MGLYLAYDAAQQPLAHAPEDARPRLLIAVRPEDIAFSKVVLGDEFNTVICHSYEDACAAIVSGVDLVTCGVHFDNGRVFDLLRRVRGDPGTAELPFFILLGAGSRYSPAIIQGIRAAAKLLKVTAFTDLNRFADKLGKEESLAALRQGIRDAIAIRPRTTSNQECTAQIRPRRV
ncbi:hypothetical protein [Noviherbaspirillum denitrificans]|uniref:Response regulatory domain-containing protein n=1 Tax=Noviherbaspirillum denitrificans TaxID=1968433 RepID=A0A254TD75_9BURK|nr:hypothetical protein [Noviherbaspirillum denitrificans]OWW20564.1 hypothetical protein AYR66_14765 [Noviherbaspirillum denitrificans]